jgi:hypothetical protein
MMIDTQIETIVVVPMNQIIQTNTAAVEEVVVEGADVVMIVMMMVVAHLLLKETIVAVVVVAEIETGLVHPHRIVTEISMTEGATAQGHDLDHDPRTIKREIETLVVLLLVDRIQTMP